jgi:hypothetical protein
MSWQMLATQPPPSVHDSLTESTVPGTPALTVFTQAFGAHEKH